MSHYALHPRAFLVCVCALVPIFAARSASCQPAAAHQLSDQPTRMPDAIIGRPYTVSLPLASSVGQVKCVIRDGHLPEGLTVSGSWIKGTPKKAEVSEFQIEARDEVGQEAAGRFMLEVLRPPAPPLTIPNGERLAVVACVPQHHHLVCAGGYPPYTLRVGSGTLPQGLTLEGDAIVGCLVEAVAETRNIPVQIVVQDSLDQSASGEVVVEVHPNEAIKLRLGASLQEETYGIPPAVQGRPFSVALHVSGGYGSLQWAVTGSLPEGLELKNGVLEGTPLKSGISECIVTVADQLSQRLSCPCKLEILPPSPDPVKIATTALPEAVLGEPWTALLEANGGFHPWTWNVQNLPPWARQTGSRIAGTPRTSGDVGATKIEISLQDASGGVDGPLSLPLQVASNPRFPPPELTFAELPPAIVDELYEVMLPATGGCPPLQFQCGDAGLPPGLDFVEAGFIRGIPTSVGIWSIPVTVTDSLGQTCSASRKNELALRVVAPPPPPLEVITRKLPGAFRNVRYDAALQATGGYPPYIWYVEGSALPQWLKLDGNRLSGQPDNRLCLGQQTISMRVTDSAGTTTPAQTIEFSVQENPLRTPLMFVSQRVLPVAVARLPYLTQLVASGGSPPYHFEYNVCPGNLQFDPDGTIRGTPEGPASHTLEATVTDADGDQVREALELRIVSPGDTDLHVPRLSAFRIGVAAPFEFVVPTTGGVRPFRFVATEPWPEWLSLDATTGRLSGTPDGPGYWNLRIELRDVTNQSRSIPFELEAVAVSTRPGRALWWITASAPALLLVFAAITVHKLRRRGWLRKVFMKWSVNRRRIAEPAVSKTED